MASLDATHLYGREALASVLKLLHAGKVSTRAQLTERLGVTRARVGVIVGRLEQLDLLRVEACGVPVGPRSIGRPSYRLTPNPSGPVVGVAQLHADGFSVGLAELGGNLFAIADHPLRGAKNAERVLTGMARACAEQSKSITRPCIAVAVALPLPVTLSDGHVVNPDHFGWPADVPARQILAAEFLRAGLNVGVSAANDADLEALAEYRRGAGSGARHMLYVTAARRGVGGALVTDGHIYGGSEGLAMEVGHLPVRPNGRPCSCGARGCFGVETDPAALLAAAGVAPKAGQPTDLQALRLLEQTSRSARRATALVRERLGVGLAVLVDLLDPDRIVLGGLHAALFKQDSGHLADVVARRGWMTRRRLVPILAGTLPRPALSGAAELAFQPLLDDPLGMTRTRGSAGR